MKRLTGILLLLLLATTACSGATASSAATSGTAAIVSPGGLSGDYEDALSIEAQLAVGTLQLEGGDLAVDSDQAATLLTYWNALQSLRNSGTAAQAELNAVVAEIERNMTPAQITAIAEMALTNAGVVELAASGDLAILPGGFARGVPGGEEGGFAPPAGGAGGGIPGGRPGGGRGGGAGLGGVPGGGAVDEATQATRQAQFESGAVGGFQEQAMTRAVIGLLQEKTGIMSLREALRISQESIAAETGYALADVQTAFAAGTLAQLISDAGSDVATVRAVILTALDGVMLQDNQSATEWLDGWLAPLDE